MAGATKVGYHRGVTLPRTPLASASRFVVAGVLALATLWPPTAAAAVSVAEPAASTEAGTTVTLISGDQVTLGKPDRTGEPSVLIDPRTPAAGGFSVRRDAGRVTVVPRDLEALVPDVLDPALFDVTGLIEMRYDDAHRTDLPVIVQQNVLRAGMAVDVKRELPSVGAAAGVLPKERAAGLRSRLATVGKTTGKIWLDKAVQVQSTAAQPTDPYLNQVKAQAAWATGLTGQGVKVAVLDTGVDSEHPALTGKVTAEADFTTGASPADSGPMSGAGPADSTGPMSSASAVDRNGHGTHVASLIVGNGAGADGARQGVAPAAELISGKVLADNGFGQESWVIAGMEWAAAQGADLVNLSLSSAPGNGDDLVAQALDRLTASTGTLFVAAAGNRGNLGADPYTIGSPGIAASALTVGAVDGADKLAIFSSEGPTKGSYRLKPDLVAPGINIPGAKAGAREGNLYVGMSGTSQATPIVTGAAALLLQQDPRRSWQQVKAKLTNTADAGVVYTGWTHGAGRLDLQRAVAPGITADSSSIDFNYLRYPDKAPRSQQLTLSNPTQEPLTVTITDQQTSQTNIAAPTDAVIATPSTLTIPAGGTGSTTVSLDPARLPDGLWQGGVDVQAGEWKIHLPFGAYDEPERYDLTVKVLDRTGAPYGGGQATVFNYDTGGSSNLKLDANGTGSVRMDPGHYAIFSAVTTAIGGQETFALAGSAEVAVTKDTTYVVDARRAQVLRAPTVEGRSTALTESAVSISRHGISRGLSDFYFFTPEQIARGLVHIQPTSPTSHGSFEATTRWRLDAVGPARRGDPAVYEILLPKDRFTSPLTPRLDRRALSQMARVENSFGTVSGAGNQLVERIWSTAEANIGWLTRKPVAVPSERVELLTADPAAEWKQCLSVTSASTTKLCDHESLPYKTGERTSRTFGVAVHPGAFAASHTPKYLFADVGMADASHDGKPPAGAYASRKLALYRDGQLVSETAGGSSYFQTPNASGRFRLEQSWQLAPAAFGVSASATTTWNFTSAPPPDPTKATGTVPPLLNLGYDADVDGYGRATPWRLLPIDLHVKHLTGSTPSAITGATLSYSVDGGQHWTKATVIRTGSGYRAIVPPWVLSSGKQLSLRAGATDAAGNTIEQTVIGAIPVR